ncbi:sigma-70 family RNA polymerase sigma factor [Metabacillus fastidiosus]|uniref:sigma-70 family RNA polymerase sigma factor n=1 Tax=Metabacillus fastidiosus TaxID=1458 RepID=UPI000825F824|nr:sigma-70 family RNA polymerase sigma factor [Metabacillus fastidiosus]MED4462662.1 sigma-70 family RNA polymerase sigma factor [Metabacillus fastidiosus]MED4531990.1 sigma-70 family RNA polymerase sigma factor [Metabacillus fastidiosus]
MRTRDELSKDERLEWLMTEYGQSIARLAFTYTKQKQLSEDIAQEVFIKCYQKLDEFRHESSYKTWLYSITVNLCKDKLKSWTFRNIIFTDLFSTLTKTTESPEAKLIDFENNRYISEKIISLPIKYREVIILYYYEELSYNQISELLNIKLSIIKSRLHRARHLLKKKLEGSKTDGEYVQ